MFSHYPLDHIIYAETMRFHARYNIHFVPQRPPRNFCLKDLTLFQDYLFKEVLELYDWLNDTVLDHSSTNSSKLHLFNTLIMKIFTIIVIVTLRLFVLQFMTALKLMTT